MDSNAEPNQTMDHMHAALGSRAAIEHLRAALRDTLPALSGRARTDAEHALSSTRAWEPSSATAS